jgi:quinol monooxygenase YgiN
MPKDFHLYVRLTAAENHVDDLRTALQSLSVASLATEFCLRFDVSESVSEPGVFFLFESFTSKEVYPDHVATEHAQHFLNYVVPNFIADRGVVFLENTSFTS